MNMFKFAALVSWLTARSEGMFSDNEIQGLQNRIQNLYPSQEPNKIDPALIEELLKNMNMIAGDDIIPAIKSVRTITGLGLKEAKDMVEKYRRG